jgi:hypothetical protein
MARDSKQSTPDRVAQLAARMAGQAEEAVARGWIKFMSVGDYVIGRLVKIQGPHGRISKDSYNLQLPNDEVVVIGAGGNLSNMIRAEYVGLIVTIVYASTLPRPGKPNPMKQYKVYVADHWPTDDVIADMSFTYSADETTEPEA